MIEKYTPTTPLNTHFQELFLETVNQAGFDVCKLHIRWKDFFGLGGWGGGVNGITFEKKTKQNKQRMNLHPSHSITQLLERQNVI